jgi:hypothetical protein
MNFDDVSPAALHEHLDQIQADLANCTTPFRANISPASHNRFARQHQSAQ